MYYLCQLTQFEPILLHPLPRLPNQIYDLTLSPCQSSNVVHLKTVKSFDTKGKRPIKKTLDNEK